MRNAYKGTCYKCGKTVEIGAGHFERMDKGFKNNPEYIAGKRWRVQCAEHGKKVDPLQVTVPPKDYKCPYCHDMTTKGTFHAQCYAEN